MQGSSIQNLSNEDLGHLADHYGIEFPVGQYATTMAAGAMLSTPMGSPNEGMTAGGLGFAGNSLSSSSMPGGPSASGSEGGSSSGE